MEITVHRGDDCTLLNNSQPYKWKVRNPKGGEATMPSVCFLVPPTNKEAVESVTELDGGLKKMFVLWQRLHVDMKSLLSWQYLMRDIQHISSWNFFMVEEYRLALKNLELHYQNFMKDSPDSEMFGADDRLQAENGFQWPGSTKTILVQSLEQGHVPGGAENLSGEQDETLCKTYMSQIRDLRLRLESCENRTVSRLRHPVDKEPLQACTQRASDQKQVQIELESIKKDLGKVATQTESVLASPQASGSMPLLRSELDATLKKMDHVYSLSSVYIDKLKTIDVVIRSTQEAEEGLKKFEGQLRNVNKVPAEEKEVKAHLSQLKKLCEDADKEQATFERLDQELQKAAAVHDRMRSVHSERDAELEHYRSLITNMQERWQAVSAQIDLRQRELDNLAHQMKLYRDSYDWLITWAADAKQRQEKSCAAPIRGASMLKDQLAQEKKLLQEIEKNKDKVDECQKYAKSYIDAVKDYELQLVTYKALGEPLASPAKKSKMDSVSDNIIQEYVNLRTRYSELLTLMSQYIIFITDTQRRLEDEEVSYTWRSSFSRSNSNTAPGLK
ncbi:plectin-like [Clupea harengus]|uniref:Plectin-like n=1 Tax=Clupea harengus TaxID=7950 RepID=A0A6P8GTI6_CLUHA|nr:plectin-like [Clupea harengus]